MRTSFDQMCFFVPDDRLENSYDSREPWQLHVLTVNPPTWGLGRTVTRPCWTPALIQTVRPTPRIISTQIRSHPEKKMMMYNGCVFVRAHRSECHGGLLYLVLLSFLLRLFSNASKVHIRLSRMMQTLSRLPCLVLEIVAFLLKHQNFKENGRIRGVWVFFFFFFWYFWAVILPHWNKQRSYLSQVRFCPICSSKCHSFVCQLKSERERVWLFSH